MYVRIYCTSADELWHSFEAQLPGTTQDHLQIFNIEMKAKMKSHQMPEQVIVLLTHFDNVFSCVI